MTPAGEHDLSSEQLQRYARNILVPQVGLAGQQRLRDARVLVVGAGGLGSPALLYLAAAGVGTIGVADGDVVETSNLQRQVVHDDASVGMPKPDSASARLGALNPDVRVRTHVVRLDADNALQVIGGYQVVVDGTDTFAARYLIGDACALLGLPHVWGSVLRFDGQAAVWWAGHGPCYRCVFPEPPAPDAVPSCAEAGVLGVIPAVIGSLQAAEAIKLVLGVGDPLLGRMLLYDGLRARFHTVVVQRDPRCALCGEQASITDLSAAAQVARDCEPVTAGIPEVDARELARMLGDGHRVGAGFDLLDVRTEAERAIAHIPGDSWIPLPLLQSGAASGRLDAGRPLIVYCASGLRARRAAHLLRAAGHQHVRVLRGGLQAWTEQGTGQPRESGTC